MLAEHAAGDSYRTLGQRHGMSHEAARQVVVREGRRFVDEVERDLLVAWKLTQQGSEAEAQWPTFLVPHQLQEGWQKAFAFWSWVVDQLKSRGLGVHLRHTPTRSGSAVQLTITSLGGITA